MPYIVQALAEDLSDDGIIGNLRQTIRRPQGAQEEQPFIAAQLFGELETVVVPKSLQVREYTRDIKPAPRRVPRAWWGWIVNPRLYYRKARRWALANLEGLKVLLMCIGVFVLGYLLMVGVMVL